MLSALFSHITVTQIPNLAGWDSDASRRMLFEAFGLCCYFTTSNSMPFFSRPKPAMIAVTKKTDAAVDAIAVA
jgi:hypothetical protein